MRETASNDTPRGADDERKKRVGPRRGISQKDKEWSRGAERKRKRAPGALKENERQRKRTPASDCALNEEPEQKDTGT